ncbi:MAG: hypothetical protein ACRDTA_00840 [Pseudonocardiaceae bacterium]
MDVTSTEDAKNGAGLVRAGPGAPKHAIGTTNGSGSDGAVAATSAHERPFPTGADY